ncbi:MAG: hypothetical protein AAF743_01605 [Planctomycetota bacterium]
MTQKMLIAVGAAALALVATSQGNLVVNGDFEAGNTGFLTDFTLMPGNIVPADTYDVVTDPSSVHPSADSYGDKTTGSGFMMAVNGTDGSVPALVWGQTVSVDPDATYELDLWTSTWFSRGELTVTINGVDQGDTFFTPVDRAVWELTERVWASGGDTSATIEIFNTSMIAFGNDFAIDDISFTLVPEPAVTSLLAMAGLGLMRRRYA